MEQQSLIYRVYDFFNHIIHPNELNFDAENKANIKTCPVTGLDISMQPKNSKFLSVLGVKWYYEYDRRTFDTVLATRLSEQVKGKDSNKFFRRIAHSIRNAESNPRNNTKRAIQKLLNEKNSLFNNMQLIDKSKLEEAGMNPAP